MLWKTQGEILKEGIPFGLPSWVILGLRISVSVNIARRRNMCFETDAESDCFTNFLFSDFAVPDQQIEMFLSHVVGGIFIGFFTK